MERDRPVEGHVSKACNTARCPGFESPSLRSRKVTGWSRSTVGSGVRRTARRGGSSPPPSAPWRLPPVRYAALKAVRSPRGTWAFESPSLRHAPIAQRQRQPALTRRVEGSSPSRRTNLLRVAQRTEHPGPNGTVARSSRARRTPSLGSPRDSCRSRLTGRAPGFYPGLTGFESSGRRCGCGGQVPRRPHKPEEPFDSDTRHEGRSRRGECRAQARHALRGGLPCSGSSAEEHRPDATEAVGSTPARSTLGAVDEEGESPAFQAGHVAGSRPVRAAIPMSPNGQGPWLLTR